MLKKTDQLKVWAQGRDARLLQQSMDSNPYPSNTHAWIQWIHAWEWFDKLIDGLIPIK